ncbi:hypothetical protein FACS189487_06880 [Campylobacterota bacterium]|nr:hypothetical protein FACS189487_06880 [Campylobacterota bacterium]
MDSQFISIVEQLVREQGTNALLDLTKCKSLLNDYAKNEYKKERHLLLLAIEIGAAKEIANATDLTIAKKIQVRTLKEDRFIDETAASEAIDLLALVLRGDRDKNVSQSINHSQPTSQNRPQLQPQEKDQPHKKQPAPKKSSKKSSQSIAQDRTSSKSQPTSNNSQPDALSRKELIVNACFFIIGGGIALGIGLALGHLSRSGLSMPF